MTEYSKLEVLFAIIYPKGIYIYLAILISFHSTTNVCSYFFLFCVPVLAPPSGKALSVVFLLHVIFPCLV